jgi:hypothetical protein
MERAECVECGIEHVLAMVPGQPFCKWCGERLAREAKAKYRWLTLGAWLRGETECPAWFQNRLAGAEI